MKNGLARFLVKKNVAAVSAPQASPARATSVIVHGRIPMDGRASLAGTRPSVETV